MVEVAITYESLYDILRREKTRVELQKLDKNFFENATTYIKEKKFILESQKRKSSIFAEREVENTKKQIINIKKMLKELYDKRELKILQLALSASRINPKQDLSVLLGEERYLFNKIVDCLNSSRRDILENLLISKMPKIEPKIIKTEDRAMKLIRFLNAVPKFVGGDLKIYGPFEKEDTANLPTKIADLLIKNNKAEEI